MFVNGNVGTISNGPLEANVHFVPLVQPTILEGKVLAANFLSVQSSPEGDFRVELVFGPYRVAIDSVNMLTIHVPEGDGEIGIDEIIQNEALFEAAFSTLGWITKLDGASLRDSPWRPTHRFARLTSPEAREPREWVWVPESLAPDDGISVIKPFNIAPQEPGRWHVW